MNETAKDCTVVIRSIGERTASSCHAILQDIFGNEPIFMIREQPFHKAIERSYEIALRQKKNGFLK